MTTVRTRLRTGWNGEKLLYVGSLEDAAKPGYGLTTIYCTGYTGNADTALKNGLAVPHTEMAKYGSWWSIHAGGTDTFGNDTAVTSIQGTVDLLTAEGYPGPYLLYGASMGFCDLMNWARLNPNRVKGFLNMYGLYDLNDAYARNIDLAGTPSQTAINAAYGGAYDPVAMGPTRNPIQFMDAIGKPIQGFIGTADALIPPNPFMTASAAHGPMWQSKLIQGTDHSPATVQAAFLTDEYKAFMAQMAAA